MATGIFEVQAHYPQERTKRKRRTEMVCQGGAGPHRGVRRPGNTHERAQLALLTRGDTWGADRHAGLCEGTGAGRKERATGRLGALLGGHP